MCEGGQALGAAAVTAAAADPIGTDVATATVGAAANAATPTGCATTPATDEPHAPPAAATTPEDAGSSDDDVPPPVADALAFLRDRVPPDSLVLLSTRGNSLDSLGAKDTEAVQPLMKEVFGALAATRGKGLARPERWLLLLSMPRWLFAKPPEGTTPAEALQKRARRFFSGDFESLWNAHKWESKLPTLTSHAREIFSNTKQLLFDVVQKG